MNISKREYFAAHAPIEIPEWFYCERMPMPKIPEFPELTAEQSKVIRSWLRDDLYNLPDDLLYVQKEYENYRLEIERVKQENEKKRYFEWRKYYGEQMADIHNFGQINELP